MSLPEKLDDFLADKCFQPFSDWFHNETGKNNFWLARAMIRVNVATNCLIAGTLFFLGILTRWSIGIVLLSCMAVIIFFYALKLLRRIESVRRIERRILAHEGMMNPIRLFEVGGRTRLSFLMSTTLFGTAWMLIGWQHILFALMTTSYACMFSELYFMSCTPKPRKRKAVKVRVEAPLGALPQGA